MPDSLRIGTRVNYRYLSFPPGTIIALDRYTNRVLLAVDNRQEQFIKWVHWTSVEENFRPKVKLRLAA